MLNLDTHILLNAWDDRLTPKERSLLMQGSWSISAIVLWEISKLIELGRIDIQMADLVAPLRPVHVWPLTLEVCRAIERLDFDSDPADELIAATSIVHGIPLITRDRKIRKSKVVPIAT